MSAPASAYAALGLEPGADRAAVERAYRDLIKRYHPDRSGGDAARAAEINHAYFELRRQHRLESGPLETVPARSRSRAAHRKRRRTRRSALWPVLLIALGAAVMFEWRTVTAVVARWISAFDDLQPQPLSAGRARPVAVDSTALDGPLNETAISQSITRAIDLAERGEQEQLVQASRECHRRMRSDPELEQLDRCAAFDDTAAAYGDRDPNEGAVFNASAITARQMTAASLLSSDYLAIERRLDRIRAMVQLTLRPAPQRLPPARAEPESPPLSLPEGP